MIINATFVSVWDDGYEINTPCKVDTETGLVFDIQVTDCVEGLECLNGEYVDFNKFIIACKKDEDKDDEYYLLQDYNKVAKETRKESMNTVTAVIKDGKINKVFLPKGVDFHWIDLDLPDPEEIFEGEKLISELDEKVKQGLLTKLKGGY